MAEGAESADDEARQGGSLGALVGPVLLFAVPTALLAGFHAIPWNGLARFALLMTTLAVLLALPIAARRIAGPGGPAASRSSATVGKLALALVLAAIALHVAAGVESTVETSRTGRIALDQGENVYHGLQRLFDGENPYAREALLDPIEYVHQVMLRRNSGCLGFRSPPDQAHLDALWTGEIYLEPARDRAFVLQEARCDDAREAFQTLGIKYGPVTLAAYAPAVWLLGKPGIFAMQIVLFLALCVVLALFCREIAQGDLLLASLAFAPLLGTVHVYAMTMQQSATDLPGVVCALLSALLFQRGRHASAAFVLGLSVAAKLMPGLMYAPILLAMGARPRLIFAAAALLPFAPFALWEPSGLAGNIVFYNVVRDANRSSLAYHLAEYDRSVLLAGAAATVLWLFWRTHRAGWRLSDHLRVLLIAHVGVVGTAKIFHNNYVIWFLPLVGLYALVLLVDARKQPWVRDPVERAQV